MMPLFTDYATFLLDGVRLAVARQVYLGLEVEKLARRLQGLSPRHDHGCHGQTNFILGKLRFFVPAC